MEEQKQDVTVESSTTQQEVVNEVATDQQQTQETQTIQEQQPEQQGQSEEVVPIHKMYEWKRKAEDMAERLPTMVQEAVKTAFQSQQGSQKREYTIAELESYASEHPEYRPWVEEEKAKVIMKNLSSAVDEKIQASKRQQESEIKKQSSLKYVMDNYPDAFVKDKSGQVVGWNNNSQLTQQIAMIMQDPRFSNDPEGLQAAADIAYARYSRTTMNTQLKREQLLKQEVGHLKKGTLVEGGGKQNVQVAPAHKQAIDKLKQSGSVKDAQNAILAILKAQQGE